MPFEAPPPAAVVRTTATFLLLALGAGCSRPSAGTEGGESPAADPASSAAAPPLVRVEAVELREVRRLIETTGYLESEHRVTILPEVGGRVVEVLIDEGDRVEQGQVLARLDDREAQSALRQAEVQLADRRVRLELMEVEKNSTVRRVEQARIERDKAKAQHQRNLEIDRGLIAEKEVEDGLFALQSAEEALQVAQLDAKKAELEITAAQNAIAELEARVEAEQIKVADHQIVAPFEGVVEERMIRGGETVSAASELFAIIDDDDLVCYLRRPQRELAMIRTAREVAFTTDAVPGRRFHATIDVISPVINAETGSFRLRVRVSKEDDDAELLRPGMFVRAEIVTEEQREALMVPKAAILNEGTRSVVFAVREGVARRVVLKSGLEERDHVENLDRGETGLGPDDVVVVSGQAGLRDNTAVEIAPE